MKGRHDIELMEHADGELDGRSDDLTTEQRAKIESLGQLGELVRGHLELSADAVPDKRFANMWREIDKAIAKTDTAEAPVRESTAAPVGIWRRIGRWFDAHRGHIISGAVGAGAVAALALVIRTQGDDATIAGGDNDPIRAKPVVYRPAEIESLDTPGGTGTVFNLEDEDGSTTVIWVTPEDTVEGI